MHGRMTLLANRNELAHERQQFSRIASPMMHLNRSIEFANSAHFIFAQEYFLQLYVLPAFSRPMVPMRSLFRERN